MYPDSHESGRPYTGQSPDHPDRCPICGAIGECADWAASTSLPYPPVDLPEYSEYGGDEPAP